VSPIVDTPSGRAVEVLRHHVGPQESGQWSVGSGCLIGGDWVLTAAHNVVPYDASGDTLLVRLMDGTELAAVVYVAGALPDRDMALLRITDPAYQEMVPLVRFGAVARDAQHNVERCTAVGFPRFKERREGGGGPVLRDSAQLDGYIPPGANRRSSRLEFQVTATPRPLPKRNNAESEWSGISGAVVFAADPVGTPVAVGVIIEHLAAEGTSSLTVAPVSDLSLVERDSGVDLWNRLGVDATALVPLPISQDGDARGGGSGQKRTTPAVHLRRQLADFGGRDREVVRISEMLRRREYTLPVIVLHGMGGVGKTTVANEVAHQLGTDFTRARIFVDLGGSGLPEARLDAAYQQIFYALGVPESEIPTQPAQQAQLLQTLLARGPCLLVLDNVARADQLASLLPSSPGSAALVTSRSPLPSLDGARRVHIQPLARHVALELFCAMLGEDYGPVDRALAARIVELVDGLPLALRIAAATAVSPATADLAELVADLEDERERLGHLQDEDRGIRATFDISYRALSIEVRRFFRIVGLLPVPEADLALLAAAADERDEETRAHAAALINAQLIETVGQFNRRYRMHDLIRLYAHEKAIAVESRQTIDATRERVLGWYVAASSRTQDPPSTGHQPSSAALAWFAREHTNVLAVTQAAFEARDWSRVQILSESLRPLLWYRKRWDQLRITEDWAVEAARRTEDGRSEIQAIIYLAEARRSAGLTHMTVSLYERALQISRTGNDAGVEAWITTHYGDSFMDLDRPEQAIEYYERALILYRSVGDEGAELWLAAHFIDAYLLAGRYADAVRAGEEGLARARRRNDRSGEIWVLWHLALAYRDVGRFDEAMAGFRDAVDDSRSRDDLGAATHMLMLLGQTQMDAGLDDQAKETLQESLRLAQGVGIAWLEQRISASLAKLAGSQGERRNPSA